MKKRKHERKIPRKQTLDLAHLKQQIQQKIRSGKTLSPQEQIIDQRPLLPPEKSRVLRVNNYVRLAITGFDELMEKGIPKGSTTLICGGPGSGKTIFSLQILHNAARAGKKGLYMTFEETAQRLREHMQDFGWNPEQLEKKGLLHIEKFTLFEITRQVEAMMEQAKGELLIDLKPVLFHNTFKPDFIIIDSLSAIASAFIGKEEAYRMYVEQLFNLLEQTHATSFLIAESTDVARKLTVSGVEEFMADGVIVLYNIRRGNVRESAIEILKMRGAKFQKKIAAMQIISGKGIVVYPEQEVFGELA